MDFYWSALTWLKNSVTLVLFQEFLPQLVHMFNFPTCDMTMGNTATSAVVVGLTNNKPQTVNVNQSHVTIIIQSRVSAGLIPNHFWY